MSHFSETPYQPLYPGWYYSYVDIPDYEDIQKELLSLLHSGIKGKQTNPDYYNVYKHQMLTTCPKLFKYLSDVGILNKFQRVLFSTNVKRSDVVHVDGFHPITRNHFSLNIPLIDCENSYTAFYKYDKPNLTCHAITYHHFAYTTMDTVEEVARVECIRPVLVNTTILHRGISDKLTRTLVGLRFFPALTIKELKQLGIKNPLVQEDV
jgi:hypothetical protein